MFGSIKDDIVRNYRFGGPLTRIVYINVGVFVLFFLLRIVLRGFGGEVWYQSTVHFFSLSSSWKHLLFHPWVFITANFLHLGAFQLLFNMVVLYAYGRIPDDLIGSRHILPIYILGGIVSGFLFAIFTSLLPYGPHRIIYAPGAFGGVAAMVAAATMLAPDYEIRLPLLGNVRIKYITAVLVLINVLYLGSQINKGEFFAYIGGFLFGLLYIHSIRNGQDIGSTFNRTVRNITGLFASHPREPDIRIRQYRDGRLEKEITQSIDVKTANPKKTKRKTPVKVEEMDAATFQAHLDAILDKIRESGYESLSQEEKDFLIEASKR